MYLFFVVAAGIASFGEYFKVAWKEDVLLPCISVGIPEPVGGGSKKCHDIVITPKLNVTTLQNTMYFKMKNLNENAVSCSYVQVKSLILCI